ncbi:MAG: hypothetical protein R6X33_15450 [Candidatus Brocadiia bacterium]
MLSFADPIGKIQQIYMEGDREVPYTTFMTVFNELLIDKVKVVPKEPSEELAEVFRAVCMAANVGVIDREGRGERRLEEFREKVLPVWKETLTEEQWEKFERILSGRMRRKARGEPEREEVPTAPDEKEAEVLARLGLLGRERAPATVEQPEAAATEPEPEEEAPVEAEPLPDVFPSVDALVEAIKEDRLEVQYTTREESEEFASYRLGDREVSVMLARADDKVYAILKAPVGYEDLPGGEEDLEEAALAMRYAHMRGHAYMREDEDLVYTLRVGPHTINMACALAHDSSDRAVVLQIQRLHRDLGELLERLGG